MCERDRIWDIGDRRRVLESEGHSPTLISKMGTGGNNVPIILEKMDSIRGTMWDGRDVHPSITRKNGGGEQRMPDKGNFNGIMEIARMEEIDKVDGTSLGAGATAQTLVSGLGKMVGSTQDSAVVFTKTAHPMNADMPQGYQQTDTAKTLNLFNASEARAEEVIVGCDKRNTEEIENYKADLAGGNTSTACVTGDHDSRPTDLTNLLTSKYAVRRITPTEAERLMGFPDGWTKIPWNGKPADECPDGPRYKACGNSMCVNCMEWIGERIQQVEEEEKNK